MKIISFTLGIQLPEVCGFSSTAHARGLCAVGQPSRVSLLGSCLAAPREGGFLHGDLHSRPVGSTRKAFQLFCSWKKSCPQVSAGSAVQQDEVTGQGKLVCLCRWMGVQPACALHRPKPAQLHQPNLASRLVGFGLHVQCCSVWRCFQHKPDESCAVINKVRYRQYIGLSWNP